MTTRRQVMAMATAPAAAIAQSGKKVRLAVVGGGFGTLLLQRASELRGHRRYRPLSRAPHETPRYLPLRQRL